MNVQLLPKIELHLHLDCSLSYEVVAKIDSSISLEDFNRGFVGPEKFANLADFLTRAVKGFSLMQTKEQLQLVVHDLFKQLQSDNVIYAEIRFAPLLHTQKGLTAIEVIEAVESATAEAVKNSGVEARLILCTLRHFDEAQSMATVQLAEQFKNTYVAGFDIAGDEAGFPITNHVAAFKYAKEKNIPITAHAGEACGPESVWETLEHFNPSRIGHGARSIEDAKLVDHLRTNNIHLEICPACNVQTNMYEKYKDHPVDKLYKAGISVGISTDCQTIVNTTLTGEYEQLQKVFGWTKEDFFQCNVNALNASFISEVVKEKLIKKLMKGYNKD